MDTRTTNQQSDAQRAALVEAKIAEIKAHMPEVYKAIQAKAAAIGKPAYALVRRGLAGEPNTFYALEGGRVVGTPFALHDVARDVAQYMVTFGCVFVCIFGDLPTPTEQPGQATQA